MLIIGTSNNYRFENVRTMIASFNSELMCVQEKLNIEENGQTSEENVSIKLDKYSNKFNTEILCIDDSILLENSKLSPETYLKRGKDGLDLSNEQIINYWNEVLKLEDLEGRLVKSFGVINKNHNKTIINVSYPITLKHNLNLKKGANGINNFIVPKGYNKFISELTAEELNSFRQPQIKALKKLIRKLY